MRRPNFRYLLPLALLCSTLGVTTASALPEDREAPISVQSDNATRTADRVIYRGNVFIQQGTMQIKADEVVIKAPNNKVQEMIATGQRAYFEQQPAVDSGLVKAWARTIEYRLNDDKVVLKQAAEVVQVDSSVSGDHIIYSMVDQSVKAKGASNGRGERVRMVLQPETATP